MVQFEQALAGREKLPEGGPTVIADIGECVTLERHISGDAWEGVAWSTVDEAEDGTWWDEDPVLIAEEFDQPMLCELSQCIQCRLRLPSLPPGEYRICESFGDSCTETVGI